MHASTLLPARRSRGLAPARSTSVTFEELDQFEAELSAIVVDLSARARYGKVEGVALPLLEHAQGVSARFTDRLRDADGALHDRFDERARTLGARLEDLRRTFASLQTVC